MKKIWYLFIFSKIIYMILAIVVYSKLTTLGDTKRYLEGQILSPQEWLFSSTLMMDALAGGASLILGPIFGNLPFVFLSTYGIYFAVKRLELSKKELIFLLLLLSLPNFGIWTSVASKESVAVFFMGIILGFVIDILKGNKKNFFLTVIAFYLCVLFKPQYLIGISALIIYVVIAKGLSLKGVGKLFLLGLFFFFSFLSLYFFRNEIDILSLTIIPHFDPEASSTRENTIWINDFDVFWNAPYGMFIAFFGPTFSEAMARPIVMITFIESVFILILFCVTLLYIFVISVKSYRLNIFLVSIFLAPSLWLLFVHYPFGVLNPGSAIRYRQNFYAFLVILIFYCFLEIKKQQFATKNLNLTTKVT